jgi:hypothetical protein
LGEGMEVCARVCVMCVNGCRARGDVHRFLGAWRFGPWAAGGVEYVSGHDHVANRRPYPSLEHELSE